MIDEFEFVWESRWDPDKGLHIDGWCLQSRPDFKPSLGFVVAHDTLEHTNDRLAGFEDELMAMGRACWIRRDTLRSPNLASRPEIITADICELWVKHCEDGVSRPLDCYCTEVDGYIEEVICGLQTYRPYNQYSIQRHQNMLDQLSHVRLWLQKGAADAQQRYGVCGIHAVRTAMIDISEHFGFFGSFVGQTKKIYFNRVKGTVSYE